MNRHHLLERALAELATITEAEFEASMREIMEFAGDQIGVNLRGASVDLVQAFSRRMVALNVQMQLADSTLIDMPLDEWLRSADAGDSINAAAFQAVLELFGGSEKAS